MRLHYLIWLAVLNTVRRGTRSLLTVTATAASVALIILMVGIGQGLQGVVTRELQRGDAERTITVTSERVRALRLDGESVSKIRSISGVTAVETTANLSVKISRLGIASTVPLYAVSEGFFAATGVRMAAGTVPQGGGDAAQVAISSALLPGLGGGAATDLIGKEVVLDITVPSEVARDRSAPAQVTTGKRFTISGVTDEPGSPLAYVPVAAVTDIGVSAASQLGVAAAYPGKVAEIRSSIEDLGFGTANVQDILDQVNSVFAVLRVLLVIMAVVTLTVASLGTLNVITVSLVEQTREIGFLRLIGIRTADVHALFMAQSLILAVAGVGAGILSGLGLGLLGNALVRASITSGILAGISLFQPPIALSFGLIAAAAAIGTAIGIGPARRAVHINPLKAVRY